MDESLSSAQIKAYQYKMQGHIEQSLEKCLELAKIDRIRLSKVATACIDDHQLSTEDFETKGELTHCVVRSVFKVLFVARTARLDSPWSVNTLEREVTKWSVACDKRLHRLISYIDSTKEHVQVCIYSRGLPGRVQTSIIL